MRKLIIVEAEEDYEYGGFSEPVVSINDAVDVAKRMAYELASPDALEALLSNTTFADALNRLGYRNIKSLKSLDEKVIAEKEYYLLDGNRRTFSSSVRKIDLAKITKHEAESLACKESMIFQGISKESLKEIAPDAYKSMKNVQKRNEAAVKARKANAEKRAETKRLKAIEEAKNLLKTEGEWQ